MSFTDSLVVQKCVTYFTFRVLGPMPNRQAITYEELDHFPRHQCQPYESTAELGGAGPALSAAEARSTPFGQ